MVIVFLWSGKNCHPTAVSAMRLRSRNWPRCHLSFTNRSPGYTPAQKKRPDHFVCSLGNGQGPRACDRACTVCALCGKCAEWTVLVNANSKRNLRFLLVASIQTLFLCWVSVIYGPCVLCAPFLWLVFFLSLLERVLKTFRGRLILTSIKLPRRPFWFVGERSALWGPLSLPQYKRVGEWLPRADISVSYNSSKTLPCVSVL